MRKMMATFAAGGLLAVLAGPALADSPSARELQSAVDGYLAGQAADASLVGGAGSAGYDRGFYIRGGDFDLNINLTLQARFEAIDFDPVETNPGRDLSGFSLPRATVKFSGHAPCDTCYYAELEFGHFGRDTIPARGVIGAAENNNLGPRDFQSDNFDILREAWIEWCSCDAIKFRMGQIKTPNTRQLMTAPELQQFVDVSLASAFTGSLISGYTDRNRDHGFMVHGMLGCNNEWGYMLAVTNGDGGDSIRNVLDRRTDDNLAASARINWAFLKPTYYEEGALRQSTCEWYGEVGAWAWFYADRRDGGHTNLGDNLVFGADLALGYGGFSFTAAFTMGQLDLAVGTDPEVTILMAQLGYLFPGTAWELAARFSSVTVGPTAPEPNLTEIGGVINYYINGHANKVSLDVSLLSDSDALLQFTDVYTGIQHNTFNNDDVLIRFQWQLAL